MASQTDATKQPAATEKDAPSMLAPDTTLELIIPWTTVEPIFQKVARKVAQRVKIDGFRKGKVPAHLAKQLVGDEQIIEGTLQEVVPPAYVELLQREQKRPLGDPEFHPESVRVGQDWQLHVHIAEKPEIKLGNWKKIAQDASKKYLEEKTKRDKADAKGSGDNSQAENPATIRGPATTDPEKERSEQLGLIYGALVSTIRPRIPELLVKQEAVTQLKQLNEQLTLFNLTMEAFLKQRHLTEEQLTNQVAGEALGRLQLAFIIDAIIIAEKFQPTPEDLTKELADKTKEIRDYYEQHPDARQTLEHRLAQQRTEAYLLSL